MNLDSVIANAPEVRPLDNERAAFYLKNHAIIETWAALRKDAGSEIAERILDLADPLQFDLKALGETDVEVGLTEGVGRPSVSISREAWHRAGALSPVTVSLEWEKETINGRGALRIYPCLRARQGHPEKDLWAEPLTALGKSLRVSLGTGWSHNPPRWLVWRYISVPEESWTAETIAHTARAELLTLWGRAAPLVDTLLLRGQ